MVKMKVHSPRSHFMMRSKLIFVRFVKKKQRIQFNTERKNLFLLEARHTLFHSSIEINTYVVVSRG